MSKMKNSVMVGKKEHEFTLKDSSRSLKVDFHSEFCRSVRDGLEILSRFQVQKGKAPTGYNVSLMQERGYDVTKTRYWKPKCNTYTIESSVDFQRVTVRFDVDDFEIEFDQDLTLEMKIFFASVLHCARPFAKRDDTEMEMIENHTNGKGCWSI